MTVDKDKIVVGKATLKIDGEGVGYTEGGIIFRYANEYLDIIADQEAGVVKKEITMQRGFLATTLLQNTLDHLQEAMGEPPSQEFSGSAYTFGAAAPIVTEHTLEVTGPGPDGKTRTWTFTRCIAIDEVSTSLGSRDAASVIPIGFEILKDATLGSRFGIVTEV